MSDEEEQFHDLERDIELKMAEAKGYLDDLSSANGDTNRSRVGRCFQEIDKKVISLFTTSGCQANDSFPQCKIWLTTSHLQKEGNFYVECKLRKPHEINYFNDW